MCIGSSPFGEGNADQLAFYKIAGSKRTNSAHFNGSLRHSNVVGQRVLVQSVLGVLVKIKGSKNTIPSLIFEVLLIGFKGASKN